MSFYYKFIDRILNMKTSNAKRLALEEIGGCTNAFAPEGIRGHQEEYNVKKYF